MDNGHSRGIHGSSQQHVPVFPGVVQVGDSPGGHDQLAGRVVGSEPEEGRKEALCRLRSRCDEGPPARHGAGGNDVGDASLVDIDHDSVAEPVSDNDESRDGCSRDTRRGCLENAAVHGKCSWLEVPEDFQQKSQVVDAGKSGEEERHTVLEG